MGIPSAKPPVSAHNDNRHFYLRQAAPVSPKARFRKPGSQLHGDRSQVALIVALSVVPKDLHLKHDSVMLVQSYRVLHAKTLKTHEGSRSLPKRALQSSQLPMILRGRELPLPLPCLQTACPIIRVCLVPATCNLNVDNVAAQPSTSIASALQTRNGMCQGG